MRVTALWSDPMQQTFLVHNTGCPAQSLEEFLDLLPFCCSLKGRKSSKGNRGRVYSQNEEPSQQEVGHEAA